MSEISLGRLGAVRIGIAGFTHETHTSCPTATTAADFEVEGVAHSAGSPDDPLDGILLSLHGAMASEHVDKPEAELVRRVRQVVGPTVPIMVSLDFHANEDHELIDAAAAVFIGKLYPHTDTGLTGEAAAGCMVDTLAGRFHPVMAIRKPPIISPPIISPSVFQGTGVYPMKDIRRRADEWEQREPKVRASR